MRTPKPGAAAQEIVADVAIAPDAGISATGDASVQDAANVNVPLRVQGRLVVGRGAQIHGSVWAGGGAEVGDGARIHGSMASQGPVKWGRGATARAAHLEGPLITTGDLVRANALIATRGIHVGRSRPQEGPA
ncbi:MAG: hypothetical protein QOE90_2862 [Thermoplasmata archaeon]|jgi:predicted acyltransferase (DUF342 family)|nr:hypothetical protein [Thermoplasmata archaeon]